GPPPPPPAPPPQVTQSIRASITTATGIQAVRHRLRGRTFSHAPAKVSNADSPSQNQGRAGGCRKGGTLEAALVLTVTVSGVGLDALRLAVAGLTTQVDSEGAPAQVKLT